MKGAPTRPTESGRFRPGLRENEGIRLEGRDCEIITRHEGLAPVRLAQGSKPVRALDFKRTHFLPGRRIDRPVLSPLLGLWPEGQVSFFALMRPRGPQVGGKRR
jgi:hypothetical protein